MFSADLPRQSRQAQFLGASAKTRPRGRRPIVLADDADENEKGTDQIHVHVPGHHVVEQVDASKDSPSSSPPLAAGSSWWNLSLAVVLLAFYSFTFFINSVASRLLPDSASSPPKLLIMMALGRTFGLTTAFAGLAAAGGVPGSDLSDRLHCAPSSGLVISVFIQASSLIGFIPFFILSTTGEVSALAPLVAMHSMIPVVSGMMCGGERRTLLKIGAALLSMVATLLLGFAAARGGSEDSGSGPWGVDGALLLVMQLGLLTAVVGLWGTSDLLSTGVARRVQLYSVMVTNLFGVLLVLCGSLLYDVWLGAGGAWGPFHWTQALYVGSNCLAMWTWFMFVRLGKHCEASFFVPIVGSYPTVTAIVGAIILKEDLTAAKIIGLLLTVASVAALGWQDAITQAELRAKGAAVQAEAPAPAEAQGRLPQGVPGQEIQERAEVGHGVHPMPTVAEAKGANCEFDQPLSIVARSGGAAASAAAPHPQALPSHHGMDAHKKAEQQAVGGHGLELPVVRGSP